MAFYINRFKGLETMEFDVEVVTPMFISGADSKNTAELRVPAIKGALRFWWRGINAYMPLDELKTEEAKIFGDAGDEFGKSKVQITIKKPLKYDGKSRRNPVPHKNVKFNFPCFNAGDKFSLIILGNNKIHDLFKLVSILGGIGKRSRRGFGSFKIEKVNGNPFESISTLQEIISLLNGISENGFHVAQSKIMRTTGLHQDFGYIKTIELGQSNDSFIPILKQIGQSSHDNNSDYTGYAKGQERFSSPVFVSIIEKSKKYWPVITTLNTAFKTQNQNHGIDKSAQFKRDILSGGSR